MARRALTPRRGNTQNVEDKKTGLSVARQAWQVHHIRYTYRHMKILGDISVFSRIVILILDHNYLESIDDLVSCKQLIKLDIHSNQISVLLMDCSGLSYKT
ncbi:LRRIQ3 [Bugula neritina]|uniref:LRRIQ3 n=1 Tax=Bugula neritina TaxID=10212 RepID=A0A7J7KNU9_BUGNE|nr:LRRIQ3 [Bugula neritina]